MQHRVERLETLTDEVNRSLGEINSTLKAVDSNVTRLDKRVNGVFEKYEKHIEESGARILQIHSNSKDIKAIKEEKLNTIKASQWRIGLIAGLPGMIFMVCKIVEFFNRKG